MGGPDPGEVAVTIVDRVIELVLSKGELKPGAEHAIALCAERHLALAVASSSQYRLIDTALEHFGLRRHFALVHSAEDEQCGKPHPAVFLTAAAELGAAPRRCLVWEDAPAGVLAAKAASMSCIAVPEQGEQHQPAFALADLVVASLLESLRPTWTGGSRPSDALTRDGRQPLSLPGTGRSSREPSDPCSHPSPPTPTSSPSSRPSWPAGPSTASSNAPSSSGPAGPPWVFYEGPPTANGLPGLHHVWARVYKDLFCRFRTMDGAYVARRAGWDTHGLPVEVEVEKKLGITGKQQIEEQVGIAEFIRLCRESVYSYVGEFARLTTRIGYWVDMDAAYWTLSPTYIESVWWHLQQLFDQGLLYEDLKVVPYCPRCGTAAVEPRARPARRLHRRGGRVGLRAAPPRRPRPRGRGRGRVRWPCGRPRRGRCSPTPAWRSTPTLTYAVVDGLVMAEDLVDQVLGEGAAPGSRAAMPGAALVGLRYRAPLRRPRPAARGRRVAGGAGGLRHHRGGHRARPPGPGLR